MPCMCMALMRHLSGKFRTLDYLAPVCSQSVVKSKQLNAEGVRFYSSLFCLAHVFNVAYFIRASSDPDQAIMAEVCRNQATTRQAMVTRNTKTHDLPSNQKCDIVKLLLPEHFRKLSHKPYLICQIWTGFLRGSFQHLCEFGVLDPCYPASKLQSIPPMLWSHYLLPISPREVSISEVTNRLR